MTTVDFRLGGRMRRHRPVKAWADVRPVLGLAVWAVLLATDVQAQRAGMDVHGRPPTSVADSSGAADSLREGTDVRARAFRPRRFWGGMGAFAVADAAAMYGLSRLWYSGQGQTSFAWYTDRLQTLYDGVPDDGWLDDWHTYAQQDKGGHFVVAWHLARVFGEYGRWSGLSRGQAGLFGGAMSTFFQSQIEVLDGFAVEYGASRTDVLANLAGGAVGGLQVAYPEWGWFTAKYSYHRSPYYDETTNYVGNALKDYQGISYWLVVRPEQLLDEGAARWWPGWLAVSLGYSGTDLAHPISGRTPGGGLGGPVHRRQFFLSLDIDWLATADLPQPYRTLARFFSFVRVPAPAFEFGARTRWHWLYY